MQAPLSYGNSVLAAIPSEPQVTGVFPALSSTLITHAQEIRLRRGDSLDIAIQVQTDADPPDPFDISGAIIRWAAKQGFGLTERRGVFLGNEAALVVKRNYLPSEIELMPGAGRAIVHLDPADTSKLPLSPAVWDLEIVVPISQLTPDSNSGNNGNRVTLLPDMPIVTTRAGTSWEALRVRAGDILCVQGKRVLVTKVISAFQIEVDFTGWAYDVDAKIDVWRSRIKTVAGGPFVVDGDVVI